MRRLVLLLAGLAALAAAPAAADRGRDLYFANCEWCHGSGLQGVAIRAGAAPGDRPAGGPSLLGVGASAADFYLRTGYMPLRNAEERPRRTRPNFNEAQIRALVRFVGSRGGPAVPVVHPERGSLSVGFTIFTEHCAGCHQILGAGGVVTGAVAPPLNDSTAAEIAEAVRIGPYWMPRFDTNAIGPHDLDSLVRYVLYARAPNDRGGWAIGHLGPIPEGMVAWLVAGVALLGVARLIGEGAKP